MKKASALILFCWCFLLSGCTGYREIDRGYFVTSIAFSIQNGSTTVFVEALSSPDVIDEQSKRVILKADGNSARQAFENLKSRLVKPLYFEHLGAAIFEEISDEDYKFLKEIQGMNCGMYLVTTDNIQALLENDTPNGVLGYDIVALIKNREKESDTKIINRLYNAQDHKETLPVVNFIDGNLELKLVG